MKKLLIATTVAIASFAAQAQHTISIVWPFGMGDTQAQYSRSLVEEINKKQKKYNFILENRPGAGGAIGARYVASTPNSILSASTAFFVRPNFYPDESHTISNFQPLMTQCAAPMTVISKKYKTWSEIGRHQRIYIGISGLGATSHLMAMQIAKLYPDLEPVAYKGTRQASIDVMSGNLDLSVAFIGEVEGFLDRGDLYALGVTGQKPVRNINTLESHGFSGLGQVVNMHSLLVPKSMPREQYDELRNLITQAAQAPAVQRAYAVDYCEASNLELPKTQAWFDQQVDFWKRLSQSVH